MKYQYLFFISLNIFPLLNYVWLIFSDHQTDSGFSLIYSLSVIISLYCFWTALKLLLKEQTLHANVISLKKSRDFYTQQSRQIRELEEKTQNIWKDFELQLKTLDSCIAAGEYSNARQYLQQISSFHQSRQLPVYCSNTFINAILQAKKSEADKYQIHTDFHIRLPRLDGNLNRLNETDLCSLLFNLLDNAMEACRSADTPSPFFSLKIYGKGDILHLHMINSKNSSVVFNRKTTKADACTHGFGIIIMEEIAKKYNGYCLWEDKKETFCSGIILNLASSHQEEKTI